MELPAVLRQAVDQALEGVALAELSRAAERLSQRYRGEVRDGRLHLSDDLAARAYMATRLPATYAAIRASLAAVAALRPGFAPRSLLDLGAGPGSALWAVADAWPGLDEALLIEGSAAIRRWGQRLAEGLPQRVAWREADLAGRLPDLPESDLVTLCYVLDELAPEAREGLVLRLWAATRDTLLLVEPGTPAGWQRILAARAALLAAGARLLAPCPHAAPCPLPPPDWCHFARRVARSRLHRQAKGGAVPWEDEKFLYLAATRQAVPAAPARLIAPPRASSGQILLKLCRPDGTAGERRITRREGAPYKQARRLDWGDSL